MQQPSQPPASAERVPQSLSPFLHHGLLISRLRGHMIGGPASRDFPLAAREARNANR